MIRLRTRRARLAPLALIAAGLGSAVLGMSATGTLSAYTASITNTTNTAASGGLVMKETGPDGQIVCLSTDGNSTNTNISCGTINKYGGTNPLTPGGTANITSVTIANTGTTAAKQFTLTPGPCTHVSTTGGNLCTQLHLTVTCKSVAGSGSPVTIVPGTLLSALPASIDIAGASADCLPVTGDAQGVRFTFTVQMDQNAGNDVQNQTVSQNLTWAFSGA